MKTITVDARPFTTKYGCIYKTPGREVIRVMHATPGQEIDVDKIYRKADMVLGLKKVTGKAYDYLGFVVVDPLAN